MPSKFRENLFEKKYAHALLAFDGTSEAPGIALGMALYFFNFSTWTGKPGLFVSLDLPYAALRRCLSINASHTA
jgi:hypothetical protein